MFYRAYQFDGLTLPTAYGSSGFFDLSGGDPSSDFITLAGGRAWDAMKTERGGHGVAKIDMQCGLTADTEALLKTSFDALMAKRKVSGLLSRIDAVGELLANGGFETAGAGGADVFGTWTENAHDGAIVRAALIVEAPYAGTYSCHLTNGATNDTYVYQAVTTTPATQYHYEFWTRGDGTNAGRFGVYDATNSAWIVAVATTGVTSTTWTHITGDFIAPAGCVSTRLYCFPGAGNGHIALFDDVSLSSVPHTLRARLVDVKAQGSPGHGLHWQPVTLSFETADYPWKGMARIGSSASEGAVTIPNSGNAPYQGVVFTLTGGAAASSTTALEIYATDGSRHWHLTWTGTLAATKSLVIDCGANTVKNDGTAAYSAGFLDASHNQDAWFEVPAGGITLTWAETHTGNGPTLSYVSYDGWG
jgi:hypothetical protein